MAKKNFLIVVDMQNDFITGSLGSKEAQDILPKVVMNVAAFEGDICYTMDTHLNSYFESTQESKFLPVKHCVLNTNGWKIPEILKTILDEKEAVDIPKLTFGCKSLVDILEAEYELFNNEIESIELIGVCTDICVISNALLLKTYFPEVPIIVDSSCCAGVTPEKHEAALEVMRSCQIIVK